MGAVPDPDLPDPADPVDPARAARRARDGELVRALRAGDERAFGQLFDDWYDRAFDVARRIVRQTEIAEEVTQEAFLNAWRRLDTLEQPEAFGGWLLRITRNGALNRREREARSAAVDDQRLAMIEAAGAPAGGPSGFTVEDRLGRSATPAVAVEDREVVDLVWQAAEALPERDLEVLDLQLRHGFSPAEIGELLGMNRNAANQTVHRVKGKLETAVRARVLWRSGHPACGELRRRLATADIVRFGAEAVREIAKHVKTCVGCDEAQRLRLAPANLFAAVPILVVPQLIKQQSAAALTACGAPMQGSVSCGAAGAGAAGGPGSGGSPGTPGGSGAGASPAPWGSPGASGTSAAEVSGALHGAGLVAGPPAPPPVEEPAALVAGPPPNRPRMLVGTGLVLVLLAVLVAGLGPVLASRNNGNGGGLDVQTAAANGPGGPTTTAALPLVAPDETTSTAGSLTTAGPGRPDPTIGAPSTATTAGPGNANPTTRSTTTTTTPPPKVDATLTLRPAAAAPGWPKTSTPVLTNAPTPSPTLTWKVTSDATVTVAVTGPAKFSETSLTGSKVVCPGTEVRERCFAEVGSYTYQLVVVGPDGKEVTRKSATLTVAPPTATTTMVIILR